MHIETPHKHTNTHARAHTRSRNAAQFVWQNLKVPLQRSVQAKYADTDALINKVPLVQKARAKATPKRRPTRYARASSSLQMVPTGRKRTHSHACSYMLVFTHAACRAGITACKAKCDTDARCQGFVWWEDFGCRTYTSCTSTTSDGGINHAFSKQAGVHASRDRCEECGPSQHLNERS